ncbi:ABC transporter ATP-binding protein [Geodermatophilus sabuli]|uniref:ABC transporter ATP-binding protein n=1 Tax=Geodermatophilus sabuli TaxID=1564158 RepID=A0A7K3VWW3_9ACTN|nr:ABC transporter ATP-binding protein [Geodermatophilus sabuli]
MLSVRALQKAYNVGKPNERLAIADVTFDVAKGEFVCVVGPSGAGKTTLLRCLSGLLAPTSGEVRFEGAPLQEVPARLSVVFQDYSRSLMPWLTVNRNVALPLKVAGVAKRQREDRIAEVLHAVGLGDVGRNYPWQLSGGMQQRVAIARALAHQPDMLLMDEPFASVDAQTRFDLEDLILKVRSDLDITVVLVTHDIDEAVYLADRVVVLSGAPSRVEEIVPVPLGRPRNQLVTRSEETFAQLRRHLMELVTAH